MPGVYLTPGAFGENANIFHVEKLKLMLVKELGLIHMKASIAELLQ